MECVTTGRWFDSHSPAPETNSSGGACNSYLLCDEGYPQEHPATFRLDLTNRVGKIVMISKGRHDSLVIRQSYRDMSNQGSQTSNQV